VKTLPDWQYLLQEFYELYWYLPASGSSRIRPHQRMAR
jgi:dimethylpropiothetin dethiomethylase